MSAREDTNKRYYACRTQRQLASNGVAMNRLGDVTRKSE